jgi:hypothetical protein
MALSIMLARVSDAEAQAQPVGVLVQVPSTGNDCVAGSCSAHNPVPFGGSLAIPYTTTRSFPNGDEYQIDGMISIGENADGTSLPGKMYVTITFIGGPGTGGTSVGAPDQFLLHDYLDYTQNGSANDLTVEAIGSFSSGVGSGSSVTVSAEYCGGITSSPVLGPISPRVRSAHRQLPSSAPARRAGCWSIPLSRSTSATAPHPARTSVLALFLRRR